MLFIVALSRSHRWTLAELRRELEQNEDVRVVQQSRRVVHVEMAEETADLLRGRFGDDLIIEPVAPREPLV